MRNTRSSLHAMVAMAASAAGMPFAGSASGWGRPPGIYKPTNKGGRRPATMPARPRRTRAQKLRTQARRAKGV